MQKHFSHHNARLVPVARMLRKRMTEAETRLWTHLRDNQLGVKFRRQFPLRKYILDFYSHQAKLNVEIDGGQHYTDEGIRDDEERDEELKEIGIKVLRYSNDEILEEPDVVIDEILDEAQERIKLLASRDGVS